MLGVMFMFQATASAKSIRKPAGNMPRVQWAVVESELDETFGDI